MSSARFFAAAVAIFVIAIFAGVALYLVFWEWLEDLSEKVRWRLAERRRRQRLPLHARTTAVAAARRPVHSRLAWAVLAAVALALATFVVATHEFGSSETGAGAPAKLQSAPWNMRAVLLPPRGSSTRTAAHRRSSLPKRVTRQTARQTPPAEGTPVLHTTLVSNRHPVSGNAVPAAGNTVAPAGSADGGPAPLRSPKAGPGPRPLGAP